MNALRLDGGFSAADFTLATGLPIAAARTAIHAGTSRKLIEHTNGIIRTTARGRRYLDELLQYWLPAGSAHVTSA
jgi:oxygen-independent coproporphyrinogen-3 oxidase